MSKIITLISTLFIKKSSANLPFLSLILFLLLFTFYLKIFKHISIVSYKHKINNKPAFSLKKNNNLYDTIFLNSLKKNDLISALKILNLTSQKIQNNYASLLVQITNLEKEDEPFAYNGCKDLNKHLDQMFKLSILKNYHPMKNHMDIIQYIKKTFYLCPDPVDKAQFLKKALELFPENTKLHDLYSVFRKSIIKELERGFLLLEKHPALGNNIIRKNYTLLLNSDPYFKISYNFLTRILH